MLKFKTINQKQIAILLFSLMVLGASCSRNIYNGQPVNQVVSSTENKQLNAFKEAGAEKPLKVGNTKADDIIKTARQYLGVKHCMGGTTKKCMDCSGLLFTVFKTHGIQLPHNSEDQARYGKIISQIGQLKKGDLVFFVRSYKTSRFITHSGIYLGNNEFIHSSSSNGVTITSIFDPWWNEKFIFGTRVFSR